MLVVPDSINFGNMLIRGTHIKCLKLIQLNIHYPPVFVTRTCNVVIVLIHYQNGWLILKILVMCIPYNQKDVIYITCKEAYLVIKVHHNRRVLRCNGVITFTC